MADKDARVRLNLDASGFSTRMQGARRDAQTLERTIDEIGGTAEKTSRRAGGLFTTLKAGTDGAKGALVGLGSQLKSVLGMVATLGGALSIGAAIHGAQEVTSSYKDLAFAIRAGTGAAVSWQDVQKDVEAVSGRWKRSNKEVAETYASIFQETGNARFAAESMGAVAQASTASGKSMKTFGDIAGTLNEKFGIGTEGIGQGLATAVALGNKGGVSIEELGEKLGNAGASAKLLGMSGQKGLEQILAMLNLADDAIGPPRQKFAALSSMLENLGNPERMKAIGKALNVQLTDAKGDVKSDALARIFAKTKGSQAELAKVFSGPELKLVASLGQKFVEGFEASSGDVITKTTAGIDAYKRALEEGGKVAFDAAKLKGEAEGRLNDSDRNLTQAMNDFQKAFERPEMVHAIDQAAEAAPKLAHFLGNLVEFATNHPLLAGAGVIGATAAKGAVTGTISKISETAMSSAGSAISKSFTDAVAKSGAWGVAGQAAGVAIGAAVLYELGKHSIDELFQKRGQEVTDLATARAEAGAAAASNDPARKAAAAAKLREQIETAEKDKPGFFENAFAVGANMVDKDVAVDERANNIARARRELEQLEGGAPAAGGSSGDENFGPRVDRLPPGAPTSMPTGPSKESRAIAREVARGGESRVKIADPDVLARAVATQLGSTTLRVQVTGGGNGTNGLPPAAGNGSGSAPR